MNWIVWRPFSGRAIGRGFLLPDNEGHWWTAPDAPDVLTFTSEAAAWAWIDRNKHNAWGLEPLERKS